MAKTQWRRSHPDQAKAAYKRRWYRNGGKPMSESKKSSWFLGVYVAERVLSRYFDNITRMPNNNPGYDYICGKGFKIDVKSACLQHHSTTPNWAFTIRYNTIADYFLCLAFDNRESLNPMHVWLIPMGKVCHLNGLCITNTYKSLSKWNEYEKSLDKVISCCNEMRHL